MAQFPLDSTRIEAAQMAVKKLEETNPNVYTHNFKTPFVTLEGETFDVLSFDFSTLTAQDSLAVENELAALGIAVITPELSGEYLLRIAARACTTRRMDGRRFGADDFRTLSIHDFTRIRGKARSFLLRAEL